MRWKLAHILPIMSSSISWHGSSYCTRAQKLSPKLILRAHIFPRSRPRVDIRKQFVDGRRLSRGGAGGLAPRPAGDRGDAPLRRHRRAHLRAVARRHARLDAHQHQAGRASSRTTTSRARARAATRSARTRAPRGGRAAPSSARRRASTRRSTSRTRVSSPTSRSRARRSTWARTTPRWRWTRSSSTPTSTTSRALAPTCPTASPSAKIR